MSYDVQVFLVRFIETLVITYTLGYAGFNLLLLATGFQRVRRRVRALRFEDLDMMDNPESLPSIAVLVPAYNEAAVLVDAVRALTELDYPQLEIIVVNDGSSDETRDVMRSAFRMQRRDIPVRDDLATKPIRSVFEATVDLSESVVRLVFVDKENGGKADSLNAALNVCISPYFMSIDADSILDPLALKQIVRIFQEEPDTVAAGGQVGIVNDCLVQDGQIVRRSVPKGYLPLCQTVEYVRSFSVARTGFSRLNALIILSGAFMVARRDAAMKIGGFLTGRSPSRLLEEYVGPGGTTICEDMEIIVRLHRYYKERGKEARIVHTPMPVCWTELPEDWTSLSKQRRRWHRGLIEILRANFKMFLNPDYGRVGMISMPYFIYFELLGPYVELMGWVLLPLMAWLGFIDPVRAGLILSISIGAGILQSVLAVMSATWLEPVSPAGHRMRSMLGTDKWRDRWLLLAGCFLTEMGYRQMTLFWRLRATWDYFQGHTGWDKFERRGFKNAAKTAGVLAVLLWPTASWGQTERSVSVLAGQDAQTDGIHGWWGEAIGQWKTPSLSTHAGVYRYERERIGDQGFLMGLAQRWSGGGGGVEFRFAPDATVSAERSVFANAEVAVAFGSTLALDVRQARFADSTLWTVSPGTVIYRGQGWLALQASFWNSRYDHGGTSDLVGWSARLSTPWADREVRWTLSWGGESYSLGEDRDPGQLRALQYGAELRQPVAAGWTAQLGLVHRTPERGPKNLYILFGVIRSW